MTWPCFLLHDNLRRNRQLSNNCENNFKSYALPESTPRVKGYFLDLSSATIPYGYGGLIKSSEF